MESPEELRIGVVARLRSRRTEIESAIIARIRKVESHAPANSDVQYDEGQRLAVVAGLEYALMGIEQGNEWAATIPSEAVAQAHRAARGGVGLGTVLRRYHAANAELVDCVTQEAESSGMLSFGAAFRGLQRTQASLLDRLILAINIEYLREAERIDRSPEQRRVERVRQLLAGDSVNSTELGYDLDAWHLGVIGTGLGVGQAVRGVALGLDSRLLCVACDEHGVWAWLGGRCRAVLADVGRLSSTKWPAGVSLALGEPAEGLTGWRATHSQAQDAFLVSLHQPRTVTLYADIALLVPWLRDTARAHWLVTKYLSPLDDRGRPDPKLRATLRAYFEHGRNVSATGKALDVTRRTIRNRMNVIEQRLGPLLARHAELELALQLDELLRLTRPTRSSPLAKDHDELAHAHLK